MAGIIQATRIRIHNPKALQLNNAALCKLREYEYVTPKGLKLNSTAWNAGSKTHIVRRTPTGFNKSIDHQSIQSTSAKNDSVDDLCISTHNGQYAIRMTSEKKFVLDTCIKSMCCSNVLFNPFGVPDLDIHPNRGLHPRLLSLNPVGIH
jgi:hypothetical protein